MKKLNLLFVVLLTILSINVHSWVYFSPSHLITGLLTLAAGIKGQLLTDNTKISKTTCNPGITYPFGKICSDSETICFNSAPCDLQERSVSLHARYPSSGCFHHISDASFTFPSQSSMSMKGNNQCYKSNNETINKFTSKNANNGNKLTLVVDEDAWKKIHRDNTKDWTDTPSKEGCSNYDFESVLKYEPGQ